MKHALSYHDYQNVCAIANETDDKYQKQYLQTIDCLFTHWTAKLGHDKICVLGFILSRTLKYGKAVAGIPFPAFLGGVVSERCATAITSALKISKNTLRNILKELIEDGFLHAFFPEKRRGIVDTFTRYFEIDFKKLQKLRTIGSEIMSMLRTPKVKKEPVDGDVKARPALAQPRAPRLPKLGDLSIIHHELAKANIASPSARRVPLAQPTSKRIERSRPAPTEPEVVATPTASPTPKADILARMDALQASAKARRDAKASKLGNVALMKQTQLQAVIDRSMEKYYPDLPRLVVTGKAFGAMKSHLKRSAPADIPDFINWVLRSWPELATQHARTALRKLAHGDAKSFAPMPHAPNFGAFGFRMPYFLACYNNRKAEDARMGTFAERDTAAIDKANRATVAARQEAASLRALLRKTNEERRSQQERRVETRVDDKPRRAAYDLSTEQDLPTWESFAENKTNDKRK
jgi:hypothetical protein